MFRLQDYVQYADKVYIKTNSNIINGMVTEIKSNGVLIDKDSYWLKQENRLLEFIAYEQILDWAIE